MLYCKIRHIERQNDFWTKNDNNGFLSKIWEYWTDVHLHIVNFESGGQQLYSSSEEKSVRNCVNLENPLFYQKYEIHTILPKSLYAQ